MRVWNRESLCGPDDFLMSLLVVLRHVFIYMASDFLPILFEFFIGEVTVLPLRLAVRWIADQPESILGRLGRHLDAPARVL